MIYLGKQYRSESGELTGTICLSMGVPFYYYYDDLRLRRYDEDGNCASGDPKDTLVSLHTPTVQPDWHTDKEEALIQAELMRFKKISSLSKQIKKLRNLKFSPALTN